MNSKTSKLIEDISTANSENEISDLVKRLQFNLKNSLEKRGFMFYPDDPPFYQDIIGGKNISNKKDLDDFKFYEEVNFIRRGILTGWVERIGEKDRFKPIENSIKDVLIKFF